MFNWDSIHDRPRLFCERRTGSDNGLGKLLAKHFDEQGVFKKATLAAFVPLLDELKAFKAVRVSSTVMGRLELLLQEKQLEDLAREIPPLPVKLKAQLYPYQTEGVQFGLFKRAALIGGVGRQ